MQPLKSHARSSIAEYSNGSMISGGLGQNRISANSADARKRQKTALNDVAKFKDGNHDLCPQPQRWFEFLFSNHRQPARC